MHTSDRYDSRLDHYMCCEQSVADDAVVLINMLMSYDILGCSPPSNSQHQDYYCTCLGAGIPA